MTGAALRSAACAQQSASDVHNSVRHVLASVPVSHRYAYVIWHLCHYMILHGMLGCASASAYLVVPCASYESQVTSTLVTGHVYVMRSYWYPHQTA